MDQIFTRSKLKESYLEDLLKTFWYAPCDAYLRAPEVAIWNSINLKGPNLNIGCADGRMDAFLFENKIIDFAIDNDKRAVKDALKSKLYKNVLYADVSKLPFKNNSFNTVFCNSTFEHIKRDIKSTSEVARVLKKGGRFYFTVPSERFVNFMHGKGVVGEGLKKYNKRVSHFHYRTLDEWKKILSKNGLIIEYYRYYYPPGVMGVWWFLFRLTTFKILNRELWSRLRDSRMSKYLPHKAIYKIEYFLLKNSYKDSFNKGGCWVFILARK